MYFLQVLFFNNMVRRCSECRRGVYFPWTTPAPQSAEATNVSKVKPPVGIALDRRGKKERRQGADRRAHSQPVAVERRKLQRREKVNRRRQIDPTTCERDYSDDEIEFMHALDRYKRASGRMFPTCSEVLEVIRGLGYMKTDAGNPAQPSTEMPSTDAGNETF